MSRSTTQLGASSQALIAALPVISLRIKVHLVTLLIIRKAPVDCLSISCAPLLRNT